MRLAARHPQTDRAAESSSDEDTVFRPRRRHRPSLLDSESEDELFERAALASASIEQPVRALPSTSATVAGSHALRPPVAPRAKKGTALRVYPVISGLCRKRDISATPVADTSTARGSAAECAWTHTITCSS
mmetsp:Transcript_40745/g.102574  ORF Transcript_40745/g.102574 Transcript_40745/m.102574 type:complete len:132 (+) Transcript_40745:170-565(+)